MLHEIQTVEAHGIVCAEYRYEPFEVEDTEQIQVHSFVDNATTSLLAELT